MLWWKVGMVHEELDAGWCSTIFPNAAHSNWECVFFHPCMQQWVIYHFFFLLSGLDPGHQYIFAVHPHGIMPFSAFPVGKTSLWFQLFPNIRVQGFYYYYYHWAKVLLQSSKIDLTLLYCGALCAGAIFKMPIIRDLALWAGGIDASRDTAQYGSFHTSWSHGSFYFLMKQRMNSVVLGKL